MPRKKDDDWFEVKLGAFGALLDQKVRATLPNPLRALSPRARAQHFNRPKGKRFVALKTAPPPGQRRVVVKVRYVAGGPGAGGALARHVRYVERDGAGRDGDEARFFDHERDETNVLAFTQRTSDDKRHFRIILAPEDGQDFADLKAYTRTLMERAEKELGTRLDWIAAAHHDTGRAHLHLLLRGVRDDGRDLVLPRAFVQHGLRREAEGLATELLGPRLEHDRSKDAERVQQALARAERFTELDAALLARTQESHLSHQTLRDIDGFHQTALLQRLTRLEHWCLAHRDAGGWRLESELESKLVERGRARAETRALNTLLAKEQRGPEPARTMSLERSGHAGPVTGELIGISALGGRFDGPQFIALEGLDGRLWTARLPSLEAARAFDGVAPGAIVSFEMEAGGTKPSDHAIAAIAVESNGLWSHSRHFALIPSDRAEYRQALERRLEAHRRGGLVERALNGEWTIPSDFLERVEANAPSRVRLTLEDPHSLSQQRNYDGPTWLDRQDDETIERFAKTGAGARARSAGFDRLDWLVREKLAIERDGMVHFAPGADEVLVDRERKALTAALTKETGLPAHIAPDKADVAGRLVGKRHVGERTFAILERDNALTLAPWRPELDVARGHFVFGTVHGDRLSFSFGRRAEQRFAEKGLSVARGMTKDLNIGGR